jgi:nucleolar protein 53
VIAEKPSDELFAIDTAGDAAIQKKVQSRHKPLKVDEILAARSAVPAVESRKRLSDIDDEGKRKKAKVSGKEYDRLRAIAYGGEQVKKDVVQSGTTADYDPWAVQEVQEQPEFSFLEKKKPKVEPTTLKRAPVSLAKDGKKIPSVLKPSAGKSYNPNFDEWQALLIKESEKAVADEKRRLKEAQEEAERMERAAADTESDSGEESVWESEWEGFSGDEADKAKAKRPERKSATQRNKIKRRKEAERKAKHDAKMRAKEQQVQMIKALAKSVEEKERSRDAAKSMAAAIQAEAEGTLDVEDGDELELRKKQFGKIPYVPPPCTLHPITNSQLVSWRLPSKSSSPTNSVTRCAPSSQKAICSRTASGV